MRIENVEQDTTRFKETLNTAQTLRRWCTPDTLLAVTSILDEDPLLSQIVKQARKGATKVILIHAEDPHTAPYLLGAGKGQPGSKPHSVLAVQPALARMARKLRWIGLNCEPILNSLTSAEIPALARAHSVDRILITGAGGQGFAVPSWKSLVWRVMQSSEVPVCVVGEQACMSLAAIRHFGRVSLALSPQSDSETALAFASRFAQEHHSKLNIVHVLDKKQRNETANQAQTECFLPAGTLREAELFCPLDFTVRLGDPAKEILTCASSSDLDFIILRSAGPDFVSEAEGESLAQRIIREARCPVIILGLPTKDRIGGGAKVTLKRKDPREANKLGTEPDSVEEKECA